ncbi:multidrug RND transporter [Burkholderia singularis]|uniref:Multidrug RND transporter n=1 Tax=Burkholderia singularis TaxID=1503053 RepID=A0A103E5D0_9BURK|nr:MULTISPECIES: efflux transporter outer membrane subunit [Burkholderia]AOK31552.1 multidrug RND transporter [Burkholderia sp. Bp7605]KVE28608.1 multidrug RND transporter [Burkholderia singularis]
MLSTQFKLALSAISVAVLAGCVNYAGIHAKGKLNTPQDIPSETVLDAHAPAAVNWPQDKWWEKFEDPQLNQLIQDALASNPDIAEVQARMDRATAFMDYANADRYPSVDAGAGISRSRLARSDDYAGLGNRYITLRSLDVQFGYTFDLWGGKRAAWESALNRATAAEVDVQSARLNLAASVAKAYNQLAFSWELLDLSERDLDRLEKMLTLSKQRFKLGLDNQSQLKLVEGLRNRASAQVIEARNDIEISKLQLATLSGKGLDRALSIQRPQRMKPYVDGLPSNIPAELLGRRPDIVAARLRVEAELKNTDAVKADFYPNINLVASVGVHSLLGDSFFDSVSKFWRIAPAVTLPIFDAGRLRSTLRTSNADLDVAIAQYNKTLNTAFHDVGASATQIRSLSGQISEQEKARTSTFESFTLAHDRYNVGQDSFLDYLNAERQLISDETQLALLRSKQVDASISLLLALGGGFRAVH